MRVFLGVKLPERIRLELAARLDDLERLPTLRWVDPTCWHLTLKFLGEWPQERCNVLERAMLWANEFPCFTMELGTEGRFPDRGPLRVLFLHVHGGRELARLAARAGATVAKAWPDGPRDDRSFHPHLTLARGARNGVAVPQPLLAWTGKSPLPSWRVGDFSLFSSTRDNGRMAYREEASFVLRK